jgi:hypothetical protein
MPIKKSYDILSKHNAHPRDERIVFEELEHKYTIDGDSSGWISATSLLSKLHEPFDSNKAVEALMKGQRYKSGEHPLSGKSSEEIKTHWKMENYRGTALHARMEYLMNNPNGLKLEENTVLEEVIGVFEDGSHTVLQSPSTGMVYTENLHMFLGYMWKDGTIRRNSELESELGENEPLLEYKEAITESLQVSHFWDSNPHLEPYRAEWMIWNRDYKIAGTMDAVFYDKTDGTYWIYDWKRVNSGLEADLEATRYGYIMEESEWLQPVNWYTKKMRGAASELYDTKYWHYCLQLNLYRYILEKDYGLKIKGMILVQFHPSLGDHPKYHRVVFLDSPISRVLKEREDDLEKIESVKEQEKGDKLLNELTEKESESSDVSNKGQITPSSTTKRTMITRSMARQTTLQFYKIE